MTLPSFLILFFHQFMNACLSCCRCCSLFQSWASFTVKILAYLVNGTTKNTLLDQKGQFFKYKIIILVLEKNKTNVLILCVSRSS